MVKPGSWQKLLSSFLISKDVIRPSPYLLTIVYNLPSLELDLIKKLFKGRMISAPGHRGLPQLLSQHDVGEWVVWGVRLEDHRLYLIAVFQRLLLRGIMACGRDCCVGAP